ncbi:related to Exocyst complex component SEC15 [Saccharomycodes ludwigii]|uniref:Exocyst complex component SEC15 n=1 Tax=Saccharomycodes ludwigii TaxID=36035 RepID=A0A376B406_9ASCO|nr:hypothetical protein SCDLUD_002277 [Saccharomycodes ludwigii]KAH3900824.1 hypothetical protein SCDLUD_002277 [Saccharomycodes ludwigii]SSD59407.1 related to Exocyst complex component SEC15 [Saccharomycodes ludwigii]
MDEDKTTPIVSKELQAVLFSTEYNSNSDEDNTNANKKISIRDPNSSINILDVDPQSIDKWVPLLRKHIDKNEMKDVILELRKSIKDNFQDMDLHLLQNSAMNEQLMNSIHNLALIQNNLQNAQYEAKLLALQDELTTTTNKVVLQKKNFISNKKNNTKINECLVLITKCLQILELSNNCHQLISSQQFYRALQSLDTLDSIYTQDFKKEFNFQFLKQIHASIPLFKEIIKNESINLIKKFFNSNLDKNLHNVGKNLYAIYGEELLPDWIELRGKLKLPVSLKFNSPVEISLRDNEKVKAISPINWFNIESFHDAILIFTTLNEMEYLSQEFEKVYIFWKNKLVYPLDLKHSASSNSGNKGQQSTLVNNAFTTLDDIQNYFWKILGLLVFDRFLQKETDYILTANAFSSTDDFWASFIKLYNPILVDFIKKKLKDEESVIKFKDFLGLVLSICDYLKLNIKQLYETYIFLYKIFCKLQITMFDQEFTSLLNDDDFMPLTVKDKPLYSKILKICWLKEGDEETLATNININNDDFLVTLPFSPLYPMTCTLLRKINAKLENFIQNFYQYETNRIINIFISAIDNIFNKHINLKFQQKLNSTSREELAQILINLDYFLVATENFSKNLSKTFDAEIQLTAEHKVKKTKALAETKLTELIDSKVADLMEIIELDWHVTTVRTEPDLIIRDIAQYLEMMFTSTLVNLPYDIKTLLIFREFDTLTNRFLSLLINGTPSTITPQSVLNFQTDMKFLENVIPNIFPQQQDELLAPAASSPSPSLSCALSRTTSMMSMTIADSSAMIESNVRSLKSTFDELNQHINLLKSGSLDQYKSSRMKLYPRVKPDVANMLINKLSTYQEMIRQQQKQKEMQRQQQLSNRNNNNGNGSISAATIVSNTGNNNNDASVEDTLSILTSANRQKISNFFNRKF